MLLVITVQSITLSVNKEYIPRIFGSTYLNVLSGSMEPKFKKNDLAIGTKVDDTSKLAVGDVITYKDGSILVTHRITEIKNTDTGKLKGFMTKGDANEIVDINLVLPEQIVSKYLFKIPKGGLVVAKFQDRSFLVLVWFIIMYFLCKEVLIEYKNINKKNSDFEEVVK